VGELATTYRPFDLEAAIARLVDPASALKTLHWGRNYLYTVNLPTVAGTVEVVVKQFRNQSRRDRSRRERGEGKAQRSWIIARGLEAAAIATPAPVMLIESQEDSGPSFFVSRYLSNATEARYLLRAANAGRERELFPALDLKEVLAGLGRSIRRFHDAGFWHRDLSIGNVLIESKEPEGLVLSLLDLNRARQKERLSAWQRTRDLARLTVFKPEQQQILLDGYWGAGEGTRLDHRGLYLLAHHGFRWKNRIKQALRPAKGSGSILPRAPHAHIPSAPSDAQARDRVVWDRLSDQPHQHAGRLTKLGVRLSDGGSHLAGMGSVVAGLPGIWGRYRALMKTLDTAPVVWGGAGVGVRPWPEAPERLLAALDQLGTRHVLLRLHPWETDRRELEAEDTLARELSARGYDLTFAVPQNRDLVRDPARFRAALEGIAERLLPYGRRFQIGQAINRSKWGIWTLREYVALARIAEEVLRRSPDVELLGPSVIDFEFHVTAAVLRLRNAGFHFDAVSSLLYVDRRGAPENSQAGFDTVRKVALLKAIAETSRVSTGRVWITEVNWPLWEGPHSPAGRAVSVDETKQADYLSRYLLLCLGTGMVERVFWWQLMARGYGLVDPSDPSSPRQRLSFSALQTALEELEGSTLLRVLPAPQSSRLLLFRKRSGEELVVGWSSLGTPTARLPRPARRARGRSGEPLPTPSGQEIHLDGSPRYYELTDE
jgi:hypothetical protein